MQYTMSVLEVSEFSSKRKDRGDRTANLRPSYL